MSSIKIKCLIGIDESYTQNKIIECFKYRDEYQVDVFDKNNEKQVELKDKLYYDFYWLEYEELDFEKLTSRTNNKKVLFNSYCIRKGLIRKAQIAFYLKKYLAKKQNSTLAKYLPETHVFELDYLDYLGSFFYFFMSQFIYISFQKN
jgi:tubulin--tyrosine ligase